MVLGVALSSSAQTTASGAPAQSSRSTELTSQQKKALSSYNFNGALQSLGGQTQSPIKPAARPPLPTPEVTSSPAATPARGRAKESAVPSDWRAPHAELNATAMNAATLAGAWESSFNLPTPGADGRVMYTFGEGMPVVVCAPLRVCALELEAGEHIQSPPQIGDGRRWEVTPVSSGSGLYQRVLLIVKPIEAGLDTDLLVPTDRRTYVIRLLSDPARYIARVAFRYPADDQTKWSEFQAQQDAEKREAEAAAEQKRNNEKTDNAIPLAPNALDRLYFDYKLDGNSAMRPERVLDDGQRTYIFYPNDSRFREIPTLMIYSNGKTELVNFRVNGNRYIVDRLFDKAVLLLGIGKKQTKVTITRSQPYTDASKRT